MAYLHVSAPQTEKEESSLRIQAKSYDGEGTE